MKATIYFFFQISDEKLDPFSVAKTTRYLDLVDLLWVFFLEDMDFKNNEFPCLSLGGFQ